MPTRLCAAFVLLLSTLGSGGGAEGAFPLTLGRIVARSPALAGTSPSAPAWSSDGQWLAFLWNGHALPAREVWVVGGDGTRLRRLSPEATASTPAVTELVWIPGSADLIYLAGGGLFRVGGPGGEPLLLAAAPGGRAGLAGSGAGRRAGGARGR